MDVPYCDMQKLRPFHSNIYKISKSYLDNCNFSDILHTYGQIYMEKGREKEYQVKVFLLRQKMYLLYLTRILLGINIKKDYI